MQCTNWTSAFCFHAKNATHTQRKYKYTLTLYWPFVDNREVVVLVVSDCPKSSSPALCTYWGHKAHVICVWLLDSWITRKQYWENLCTLWAEQYIFFLSSTSHFTILRNPKGSYAILYTKPILVYYVNPLTDRISGVQWYQLLIFFLSNIKFNQCNPSAKYQTRYLAWSKYILFSGFENLALPAWRMRQIKIILRIKKWRKKGKIFCI